MKLGEKQNEYMPGEMKRCRLEGREAGISAAFPHGKKFPEQTVPLALTAPGAAAGLLEQVGFQNDVVSGDLTDAEGMEFFPEFRKHKLCIFDGGLSRE